MKLEREDGPRGFYPPVTQQFIALWYELEKKEKKIKSTFGLNSVGRTRNRKIFPINTKLSANRPSCWA